MNDDHSCIWRERANAMLDLVNVALMLADATVLSRQHSADFIIVGVEGTIKLRELAEKYRQLSNDEGQP